MAKELPYFKFEPNAWENGNIQMLSREDKGLFIDICSMYWSRLGELPEKLVIQKLCGGNANALNLLCEENIIELIEGNIYIKFLTIQLSEFENKSDQNSKNAKEGWEKRRKQKEESKRNATASNPQSETDAIREDKRREEKMRKEISFDEFWDLYDKKVSRDNSEKKWNRLSDKDRELIMQFIPKYKSHQPDKKFRKDPLTFFNNKTWLDEIPNKNGSDLIPENETAEEKDLRIRIESFKKIKVH